MKKLIQALSFVLLACGFAGCADKNYSKEKPTPQALEGTWVLGRDSRDSVETAYRLHIGDGDGIIKIKSDGKFETTHVPTDQPDFKPKLLSGGGEWKLSEYKQLSGYSIWRLNLIFDQIGLQKNSAVSFDIGHSRGKTFLNQPIDDPDGPVMRFYRIE